MKTHKNWYTWSLKKSTKFQSNADIFDGDMALAVTKNCKMTKKSDKYDVIKRQNRWLYLKTFWMTPMFLKDCTYQVSSPYKVFKAIGGSGGHFSMWPLDESSNLRDVNALYGIKISCCTRKILQLEFQGLCTFLY